MKLDLLGITRSSLNWLKTYLMDRKQTVRFNNSASKNIFVSSGVPQGSHLGPLLFSLFINDLSRAIMYSNILMYADDVKIFYSFNKFADHTYLQSDLDSFLSWCNYNMMELNLKKCKCMRFTRNCNNVVIYSLGEHQLELVDTFFDLGILLDPKLNFVPHITLTVNKARGVLAFIKRWAKEFSDPYITKQLYVSLVRPILEYGSVIWDPFYNVHSQHIESIQKQFLLFCLRGFSWDYENNFPSYNSRLALIRLPTLKSRRTMLNVSFTMKLITGEINCEYLLNVIRFNVPCRNTRNYTPLFIELCRFNYAFANPITRLCRQFNDLYQFVDFSSNISVTKVKIIEYLNS